VDIGLVAAGWEQASIDMLIKNNVKYSRLIGDLNSVFIL
tara:strand:+ start:420 stop:536 length:117 start_codon:yes stop_codon:yes gene_type:complete